jgi:hypothetical protein
LARLLELLARPERTEAILDEQISGEGEWEE